MLARVTNSEARDVFVRLTWDGQADFDLTVEEPLGVTASYLIPRTVFGGSMIKTGYGAHPEEVYVCPRGFDGDYTVRISTIWIDPSKPATRLTLETIAHEGTAKEQKTVYNLVPDKLDKPFVVHLSEGRRKKVLPFIDPAATMIEAQAQLKKTPSPRRVPEHPSINRPVAISNRSNRRRTRRSRSSESLTMDCHVSGPAGQSIAVSDRFRNGNSVSPDIRSVEIRYASGLPADLHSNPGGSPVHRESAISDAWRQSDQPE